MGFWNGNFGDFWGVFGSLPPQLGEGRGGERFFRLFKYRVTKIVLSFWIYFGIARLKSVITVPATLNQVQGDENRAVIPNLFRNRKVEVGNHRPCDPESSSGWQKTVGWEKWNGSHRKIVQKGEFFLGFQGCFGLLLPRVGEGGVIIFWGNFARCCLNFWGLFKLFLNSIVCTCC